MNIIESKLCDVQGRLFELSIDRGYDSEQFIKSFMLSDLAKNLDSEFNSMQWMGEEYLLEELEYECNGSLVKNNRTISKDEIYWIGYVYRFWHYYKNENSKKIYKQANYERIKINYLMFHTMSVEMAVDNLIEIYNQRHNKKSSKSLSSKR